MGSHTVRVPLFPPIKSTRPYAELRGTLQDAQAAFSLIGYRALRRARGMPLPSMSQIALELKTRLASRRPGFAPVSMGKLRVFVAYFNANWERALPQSLAEFGTVYEFELGAHGYDPACSRPAEQRERISRRLEEAFDSANAEGPVDAFIGYLSGANTTLRSLRHIARSGCLVFNLCLDDKLQFPGKRVGGQFGSPAPIASAIDLNLTNAPSSLVKYSVHGGLAMFWPEAALPEVHRPHDLAFEHDVSFAGAAYGRRPHLVEYLRSHGIDVKCFGRGWSGGELSTGEMIRVYSQSRINLGFSGIGYSRRLKCLKGRDFEVPMAGGLYLTEHNPELRLVYDLGREVVTYRSKSDCLNKIRTLLANPTEAQRIREAGRARALRDHTYRARWSTLFELSGLIGPSGANSAPGDASH